MRRLILIVIMLAALCTPALANDVCTQETAIIGADRLTDALDEETKQYLPEISGGRKDHDQITCRQPGSEPSFVSWPDQPGIHTGL